MLMMNWDTQFAARTSQMKRSTVREILKLTAQPDVISFAGGLPAPELFPVERIREATDTILAERGREAMQYSTSEGMPALREWIAARMSGSGLTVSAENILILSGSQQALDLVARVLVNEGDRVVIENPTYVGMLLAWKPYLPRFTAVPTDGDGLIVGELAPRLHEAEHKILYSIPSFQNPQGTTMSLERRQALARLLVEHRLPMYEDDPYGELVYEGEKMPSLLTLEAAARGSGTVDGSIIYAGTFSKTLTPGLRVGWVAAAAPVIDKLVQAKQATDLHTSTLSQFITYELVRDGAFLDAHIATLRSVYRERRDLMLAALAEHFPPGVTWTRPTGGLFLMVTLPAHLDAADVLVKALQEKVAFVPADSFFVDPAGGDMGRNTFRLNYSNARPERIVEGIRRLGAVLHAVLDAQAL
jgi:2-aminoadipate transaminase